MNRDPSFQLFRCACLVHTGAQMAQFTFIQMNCNNRAIEPNMPSVNIPNCSPLLTSEWNQMHKSEYIIDISQTLFLDASSYYSFHPVFCLRSMLKSVSQLSSDLACRPNMLFLLHVSHWPYQEPWLSKKEISSFDTSLTKKPISWPSHGADLFCCMPERAFILLYKDISPRTDDADAES